MTDAPRPTELIDTQAGLSALIETLAGETSLAVDTESNSFHAYFERVCLLQLSTGAADYAIDPLKIDVKPLRRLFEDPAIEIVIHAADYDIRCMKRDFGFAFARLFDTMLAAKVLGQAQLGLAALVKGYFGIEMAKVHQRSDWGRRPLSQDQLVYAYSDTRHLLGLRDRLSAELVAAEKVGEANAIFRKQAACVPKLRRFDPEGFRKIRGFRALEEPHRAVVKALYLLREDCARAANRPPFKVYGDDAILELAKVQPRDPGALARVKGLGQSTVRRNGEQILAAIAGAVAPA